MASIPTIKIWKDGRSMAVNADDAEQWAKRGWSTSPPKGAAPAVEPDSDAAEKRQRRGTSKTGDLPIGK